MSGSEESPPDESWPPPPLPPMAAPLAAGGQRPESGYRATTVVAFTLVTAIVLFPVGIFLSLATLALTSALAPVVNDTSGYGALGALLTVLLVPVAIIGIRRSGTANARSIWMGVLIGTAVYLIVGGGLCVSLVTGLS
jgi:hypothetical protein